MTSEWVWPATTTRSISRTSTAAPAAAMVLWEKRLRVPYSLFAPSRREARIHHVAHDRIVHHDIGADAADQRFASGNADPQIARLHRSAAYTQ